VCFQLLGAAKKEEAQPASLLDALACHAMVKKTGTPKPPISPFMPGFSGNTGSNLTQQSAIQSPVIAMSVALDLLRFKGFG
jgi:hypothetical protein